MPEVIASYNRAKQNNLAEKFYEKLLASDTRISNAFTHTNFEEQRKLFVKGLLMLLQYGDNTTIGNIAIKRLGHSHSREGMNIAPELYPLWVQCLLETIAELDPEYSHELEQLWRNKLKKGIDAMTEAY